jgi:xanthine dehydrogenase molybdenum-binding subunit
VAATVAEKLDCPPDDVRFVEGLARASGMTVPLGRAAEWMRSEGLEARARYEYWAPATQPLGAGGDIHFAFAFAAQAAEVEVDLETGEVRAIRVVAANDVGRALNPLGLAGQVDGGIIMGLGTALTEDFIVDEGRVFTDRLARYRMPSILLLPEITSFIVEHPAPEGPYGAKGVGEIVSIPTAPAITNAIYHACGVRVRRLPVDQDWLARSIKEREGT